MQTDGSIDPESLIGQTFYKGIYTVEQLVDVGGFSYVYRATRESGGLVAVKVLKDTPSEQSQKLLDEVRRQREARRKTTAIVEVIDVLPAFHADNELHVDLFVMEWVDGRNLGYPPGEDSGRPFSERLPWHLKIAVDICRGVEALHRDGLWHGDLTPGNVIAFETEVDGWGAKLIDLGLSREAGYQGQTAGTALYMAPEQIGQAPGDFDALRADLYALGAVLFQLFSGKYYLTSLDGEPFTGTLSAVQLDRIGQAITTEPARRLSEVATHLPPDLSDLIGRLLEKVPAARPASITEVRQKLEQILIRHQTSHFPSLQAERLEQPRELPARWDVRLHLYQTTDDWLIPIWYPLGDMEPTPDNPTSRLASPPLRLMPGETTAHVVLREQQSRRLLAAVSFEVERQPFRVYFEIDEQGQRVTSHDAGPDIARLRRRRSATGLRSRAAGDRAGRDRHRFCGGWYAGA